MRISEAAREAGVNIRTLHYYERRGLLAAVPRSSSNYRDYSRGEVRRVLFIKRAQDLGFTLEEIGELLALRIDSRATCGDVCKKADIKIADIKLKIKTLRSMQRALERLTAACSGSGSVSECPILESLESGGRSGK